MLFYVFICCQIYSVSNVFVFENLTFAFFANSKNYQFEQLKNVVECFIQMFHVFCYFFFDNVLTLEDLLLADVTVCLLMDVVIDFLIR